jgi:hypothetical protein
MADATDLKSVGLKRPCGFESRHRQVRIIATAVSIHRGGPVKEVEAEWLFHLSWPAAELPHNPGKSV